MLNSGCCLNCDGWFVLIVLCGFIGLALLVFMFDLLFYCLWVGYCCVGSCRFVASGLAGGVWLCCVGAFVWVLCIGGFFRFVVGCVSCWLVVMFVAFVICWCLLLLYCIVLCRLLIAVDCCLYWC